VFASVCVVNMAIAPVFAFICAVCSPVTVSDPDILEFCAVSLHSDCVALLDKSIMQSHKSFIFPDKLHEFRI
jgi:hypothetical protein